MISKRNEIQFRGARPRKEKEPATGGSGSGSEEPKKGTANKGRSRFNYVLKQCEDLLRTMGLQCVKGPGEAEAFCSHLNAAGVIKLFVFMIKYHLNDICLYLSVAGRWCD